MAVKDVLGGKTVEEKKKSYPWLKKKAMASAIAEYTEVTPRACIACWYLISAEPRKDPEGLCNLPQMLSDPDTKKKTVNGKQYAIVSKFLGSCRFLDPVDPGKPKKAFVVRGEAEEEYHEHEEMNEGDYGSGAEEEEEEEEENE
jgi:hypothetical protein